MGFLDYAERGYVYHVIDITDLEKTLREGIFYDDKASYESKYVDFHSFFDDYKTDNIPGWVIRRKAVFASISFKEKHKWHAHSAILRIRIKEDRCWVCNENLANFIYEPFILQNIGSFAYAKELMQDKGREYIENYWNNSLSYTDNLEKRNEKQEGYDAEVLIMHQIPPENIECLYIISDHQVMSCKEWQQFFKPGSTGLEAQYSKYLQPKSTSSASKISGLQ